MAAKGRKKDSKRGGDEWPWAVDAGRWTLDAGRWTLEVRICRRGAERQRGRRLNLAHDRACGALDLAEECFGRGMDCVMGVGGWGRRI